MDASTSPYQGPREDRSWSLVLLGGLATTALTLLGVYLLDEHTEDFHIMGWYADYLLPVGALIVGVAASSGYGIMSWKSGVKITKSLLWTVVLLQFGAYFCAQYIEFRSMHLVFEATGKPVGFIQYYDATARSFAWKRDNGKEGEPLGVWGYFFRGLEVLGFVGGGLVVPALLRKAPYCEACQRYMRTRQLTLFPASVPARKVRKDDAAGQAAYQAEQSQALESGNALWAGLRQLAVDSKGADFQTKILELVSGKKAAAKLPARFRLNLVSCRNCQCGWLQLDLLSGQGKHLKQTHVDRAEVRTDFVRSV